MASSDPLAERGVEVSNPPGTLRMRVSEAGLPLHVEIAPSLLSRGSGVVASEVLRLCRRAAAGR
jgi:hypothetical protein